MKKIFRFILFSNRRRRCKLVALTLWLLRQLRDVESHEVYRISDMLDDFDSYNANGAILDYTDLEEEYTTCEFALSVLDSAIDDLEFAY